MSGYEIEFKNFDWEEVAPGLRQKTFVLGKNRLRLLELSKDFKEKKWCLKSHTAYVIEGEVNIQFAKKIVTVRAGNGLYISGGEKSKHKTHNSKGSHALLISFESAKE